MYELYGAQGGGQVSEWRKQLNKLCMHFGEDNSEGGAHQGMNLKSGKLHEMS